MRLTSVLLPFILLIQISAAQSIKTAELQSCQRQCGQVQIQYPFGIGSNCSMNKWFEVICKINSSNRTVAFLSIINLEIIHIIYGDSQIRIKSPIASSNCNGSKSRPINLTGTSFTISSSNKFTVVGCSTRALLTSVEPDIVGCEPTCDGNLKPDGRDPTCSDNTCCQTSIPHFLQVFKPEFQIRDESCKIAFISDKGWFEADVRNTSTIRKWRYAPMIMEWKINATALSKRINKETTTTGVVRYYNGNNFPYPNNTYLRCKHGFAGNPYLFDGCKDVDECLKPKIRSLCSGTCVNTYGSYRCQASKSWIIILAISVGSGAMSMLIVTWWLFRLIKKRKIIQQKKKFFKQNGGLVLQQYLCSDQADVEKIKIFSSKELERATDRFNENRIIGEGGQGTVYKGMLVDGRIVAVKKSIKVDEAKLKEFINEVVVLSQIRHRNIVKLLGCCLETQVPVLVYEFIPNGTLYDYLHYRNEDFHYLSWKQRLEIAVQVSGALAYLHSAASIPIYHRDIKSRNILLDEKYRAKISDFGVSRLVSVDQTHLITDVQGTFGYLDPEYFQSNRFTEKSDVYSFGVVLVELLTGQEPISTSKSGECTGLAASFIASMEQGNLNGILDHRIVDNSGKDLEQVKVVADLAAKCLNLNGKIRPTMKEVTMELEGLRFSDKGSSVTRETNKEIEPNIRDVDLISFSSSDDITVGQNFPTRLDQLNLIL